MSEQPKQGMSVRRAWPWLILAVFAVFAVFAVLVPWVLRASTESGGVDYMPLVSFAALFIGAAARSFFVLDGLVVGGLPLLVLLAAVCCRRWWSVGMAVAVVLGVMAAINLALFLGELPRDVITDDVSAGVQPDFSSSGGEPIVAMLASVAYVLAAVALIVGARHSRVAARLVNG
ncbi:hypothetical protein [Planobispora longispora]|uniref:hypothetical protein n=1 Tax=Planobispora longispora TaxID=28887 RepID=UPI0019409A3C|nr:hypothetical protein [Planobispora longispora]